MYCMVVVSLTEHELTYYDDVGECYEFSFLEDDSWKKDEIFCLFAERLVRLIACDVKVPPEKISFGKWGARLVVGKTPKKKIFDWIDRIEYHPSFKAFTQACVVASDGEISEEEKMLSYYKSEIDMAFDVYFSSPKQMSFEVFAKVSESILSSAKGYFSSKNFKKLVNLLNTDLTWVSVTMSGKVLKKRPQEVFCR
jgi:hypothetical protein